MVTRRLVVSRWCCMGAPAGDRSLACHAAPLDPGARDSVSDRGATSAEGSWNQREHKGHGVVCIGVHAPRALSLQGSGGVSVGDREGAHVPATRTTTACGGRSRCIHGTPGRIRTYGLLLRRQALYPLSYGRLRAASQPHMTVWAGPATCNCTVFRSYAPPGQISQ